MNDLISELRDLARCRNNPIGDAMTEAADALESVREDAARWRELCRQIDADEIPGGIFDDAKHMGAGALEMHIDDAREARNG